MKFEDYFESIDYRALNLPLIEMMGNDYMLLTAGKLTDYNAMTVGWGGFGFLWQRPVCWTFVRPQRFTFEFTEKYDTFTLSWFGKKYAKALSICGSVSGRTHNKIEEAGLQPLASPDAGVCFLEAEIIFECRKIYFQDLVPDNMLDKSILRNYPANDFHRVYTGQIEKIWQKLPL